MILTCPRCATRYFIDAAQTGTDGRTVRCADCHESWIAQPAPGPAGAETMKALPPHAKASPSFAAAPAKPRLRPGLKFTRSPWSVGIALTFVFVVFLAFVFRTQIVQFWLA